MKASSILISVLIAVSVWWWYSHPQRAGTHRTLRYRLHTVFKSIAAGIATYFVLMMIAMLYLLVSTA